MRENSESPDAETSCGNPLEVEPPATNVYFGFRFFWISFGFRTSSFGFCRLIPIVDIAVHSATVCALNCSD